MAETRASMEQGKEQEIVLKGVGAVPGQALGPVLIYRAPQAADTIRKISDKEIPSEVEKARQAFDTAASELQALAKEVSGRVGHDEAAIFEAQSLMASDPTLVDRAIELIRAELLPADAAVTSAAREQADMLAMLDDPYLRERAVDLRDVGMRAARIARGEAPPSDLGHLAGPVILVAEDLTPSETIRLDREHVLGVALSGGGPTSHVAVVARSLGIPLVVGLGRLPNGTASPGIVIVDGSSGVLVLNPSPDRKKRYEDWRSLRRDEGARRRRLRDLPAETLDGHRIRLAANAGSVADAVEAAMQGAEGIGLLRTEFLFLDHEPGEAEQVEAYSQIFAALPGREVVVRTMDLGGDKPPPYLDFANEANPFLGWRGLRISLDRTEMFKTQIRALLRADTSAALRIMFPMVSTLDEFRRAKRTVEEARRELMRQGIETTPNVKTGIMIEVPSAALTACELAREADFFSIGTNDLTQYTMAADRGAARVAQLYSPLQPAVLRLIAMTVEAAHTEGKWVGMCGEAAGNPAWTGLWLGLGIDELSMSPPSLSEVKEAIRSTRSGEARELARRALELATLGDIEQLLQQQN